MKNGLGMNLPTVYYRTESDNFSDMFSLLSGIFGTDNEHYIEAR